MLLSMTGFGSIHGQVEGVEYAVEVRSVNNRYLKCVIKLPESWGHAESEIEKMIRSRITRGTITLSVRMKVPDEQASYRVNVPLDVLQTSYPEFNSQVSTTEGAFVVRTAHGNR